MIRIQISLQDNCANMFVWTVVIYRLLKVYIYIYIYIYIYTHTHTHICAKFPCPSQPPFIC